MARRSGGFGLFKSALTIIGVEIMLKSRLLEWTDLMGTRRTVRELKQGSRWAGLAESAGLSARCGSGDRRN